MSTVRRLTDADRADARSLWQTIFQDDLAFLNWYFDTRFDATRSFGVFLDGTLVSMALGRKVFLSIDGESVCAWLVAGVCTLPAFRKQGWMHRVMRTLEQAARGESRVLYLRPASPDIYRSLGYLPAMQAKVVRAEGRTIHPHHTVVPCEAVSIMRSVYQTVQEKENGMVVRDECEMAHVLEEYRMEEGRTLLVREGTKPLGYAILVKRDGRFQIAEQVAVSDEAHESLLAAAFQETKEKGLSAELPSSVTLSGTVRNTLELLPLDGISDRKGLYCIGDY